MPTKTNSRNSQKMPSVKLSLPAHVVLRPRKDGSARILWLLNKRDQVPGLASCIQLPIDPEKRGLLTDPKVLAAVIADAKRLNDEYKAARAGYPKGDAPGSIEDLLDRWRRTASYDALKPRSKRYYAYGEKYVRALFLSLRLNHVNKLTPTHVRTFLESPALSASAATQCRAILSVVMNYAVELRLVDVNPVDLLRKSKSIRPTTKTAVDLWTAEDVDQYVTEAEAMGWIGGAVAILGAWESQSRWFDTVQWNRSHWDAAGRYIEYRTGKSDGRYDAVARMSERFAGLVAKVNSFVLVTRPDGLTPYEEGESDSLLTGDFTRLRLRVIQAGGRKLVARHLRHSSLTHGELCGLSAGNMSVASTHTNARTTTKHYIQKNRGRAEANAIARGIV